MNDDIKSFQIPVYINRDEIERSLCKHDCYPIHESKKMVKSLTDDDMRKIAEELSQYVTIDCLNLVVKQRLKEKSNRGNEDD